MNPKPLVSVIMPAHNAEAYIYEAIASVKNQQYQDWELFVIDDASTDGTVAIIKKQAAEDSRISFLQNESNQGTAASRNSGIKAAKGTFISFLDADDSWLPEKLTLQLEFMNEQKLEMCFSSYRLMNEAGEIQPKIVEALPNLSYQKLLKSNYIGNLTGIYNAEKLGKVYAPHIKKRQDWGLWLEILKRIGTTKGILKPLACYRIGNKSISENKAGLLKYNFLIYKKVLHYTYLKSMVFMCRFLWEHFMVKKKQVKSIKFQK